MMKLKEILPVACCLFVAVFLGFSPAQQGGLIGKVNPPQGANNVVAVAGRDTLRGSLSSGNIRFAGLRAGVYQVIVRANSPYRDTTIRSVAVTDTNITDLGTVRLPR